VLIALNVAMFVWELALGSSLPSFVGDFALIPARMTLAFSGGTPLVPALATLVTSMFLHGGWLHLIGNMWYLWIFGDNVEDRMGHARFLLFYLVSGIVAALMNAALMPGSPMPTIGASGAIARVLRAYAFAFPRAKVLTLLPICIFIQIVRIPALVLPGIWFAFQFIAGTRSAGGSGGGVAW